MAFLDRPYIRLLGLVWGPVGAILATMIKVGQSKELLDRLRNYPVLGQFPDNQDLSMILTVLLGAEVYSLLLIQLMGPWDRGRKRGL